MTDSTARWSVLPSLRGLPEERRGAATAAAVLLALGLALTAVDPDLELPAPVGAVAAVGTFVLLAAWLWRARHADLLAPAVFFPIAFLAYYGFGSLPLVSWGPVPGGMFLLMLLAVASYLTGTALAGATVEYEFLRPRAEARFIDVRRAVRLLLAAGTISLVAFVVLFAATGIPILGAVEFARLRSAANGYLNTLALTIRAVIMVVAILLLTVPHVRRDRRILVLLLALLAAGTASLVMTGNRGHLVLLALFGAAAWHYLQRRLTLRAVTVVVLVGLTIYSLAGYYRAGQCDAEWPARMERHYGVPAALAPIAPAYLSVRSVPHFLSEIIEEVPERAPHTLGALLVSPVATVLPGHQPGIGEFIKEEVLHLEFVGFGVAAGLLAAPYVDFGYIGIVALMLATGAGMQLLYRAARTGRREWISVYTFAAANLVLSLYGSVINSFSVLWVPAVAFAILWLAGLPQPLAWRSLVRRPDWRWLVPRRQLAPRLFVGLVVVGYLVLVSAASLSLTVSVARALNDPGRGFAISAQGGDLGS
ncbi:MAG: oligosaccharide repeat unit polymerase, partial [Chloroflexota bacterium]|nr:oligosaccharide repeat unit polymerase [Chloroflexota bacterium]